MRLAIAAATLFAVALTGCSRGEEGESAEDFAARVGAGEATAAPDPAAQQSVPVATAPPSNVDVRKLEALGNIAGADLGPRDGGCTFSAGGNPLMLAGAPNDPAASGKGVVRAGGALYLLASAPGGMPAIRSGTRFTGQGITVDVSASSSQVASLKVTDSQGRAATISGTWVCA